MEREAVMKSRCIDLLVAEHKIILRTVDVLSALAKEATDRKQLHSQDIRGILDIFRVFADEFHQGKEESALFPVFTAVCERSEIDSIRHMLFEHDQDRSLIEGMEDALLRSNAADFAESAARLAEFLRTHIYKEDNILFDW
jgi:hemerythrin-like domain-containing protein